MFLLVITRSTAVTDDDDDEEVGQRKKLPVLKMRQGKGIAEKGQTKNCLNRCANRKNRSFHKCRFRSCHSWGKHFAEDISTISKISNFSRKWTYQRCRVTQLSTERFLSTLRAPPPPPSATRDQSHTHTHMT